MYPFLDGGLPLLYLYTLGGRLSFFLASALFVPPHSGIRLPTSRSPAPPPVSRCTQISPQADGKGINVDYIIAKDKDGTLTRPLRPTSPNSVEAFLRLGVDPAELIFLPLECVLRPLCSPFGGPKQSIGPV